MQQTENLENNPTQIFPTDFVKGEEAFGEGNMAFSVNGAGEIEHP